MRTVKYYINLAIIFFFIVTFVVIPGAESIYVYLTNISPIIYIGCCGFGIFIIFGLVKILMPSQEEEERRYKVIKEAAEETQKHIDHGNKVLKDAAAKKRNDIEHRDINSKVKKTRKCPHCAELIKSEDIVCKYCGRDLLIMPKKEEALSSKSSDGGSLKKFITQITYYELNKSSEEYYKKGEALMAKNEFDEAILEFVKAIRISSPQDKWYKSASKSLKGMGFSEADIRQI